MTASKKPTHKQMMKRPSLWYLEHLDMVKIVYPDIKTQESICKSYDEWINESVHSSSVIRSYYDFLGWL